VTAVQLTGRCFCRAIRYRCGAPLYAPTLCHCESCRRIAGAHALGWFTVASGQFACIAGTPREFESSPGVWRAFCSHCGTPFTYRNDKRPGELDVTICSLDEPGQIVPADHIWMQDAPDWDRPQDGLPQYSAGRGRSDT
jgi:hypothetical protein